eukprot:CAMPEP_0115751886 /NCGR_PEP_ID=MMETSP0272-20121206/95501_1 /TAXON_ID=71861 /ORGANISM="Scrippsiella trochoidea, Strain CCMP3099" /LENGTH=51 /DNA_ID=CAMNT_0003197107 /DNA_START=519 /DNA_END=670 /DNA_ORIENTATION=-
MHLRSEVSAACPLWQPLPLQLTPREDQRTAVLRRRRAARVLRCLAAGVQGL